MDLEQRIRELELNEVRSAAFIQQIIENNKEVTQNLKELQLITFDLVKEKSKTTAYFQILGAIVMIFGGGSVGMVANYLSHQAEINKEQDTRIETFKSELVSSYNNLELRVNKLEFQMKDFK